MNYLDVMRYTGFSSESWRSTLVSAQEPPVVKYEDDIAAIENLIGSSQGIIDRNVAWSKRRRTAQRRGEVVFQHASGGSSDGGAPAGNEKAPRVESSFGGSVSGDVSSRATGRQRALWTRSGR